MKDRGELVALMAASIYGPLLARYARDLGVDVDPDYADNARQMAVEEAERLYGMIFG